MEPAHGATFHIWTKKLNYHLRAEVLLKEWKPKKGRKSKNMADPFKDLDVKLVSARGGGRRNGGLGDIGPTREFAGHLCYVRSFVTALAAFESTGNRKMTQAPRLNSMTPTCP